MKVKHLLVMLLTGMTIMLGSCSRDKELLDTVPANATGLAVLDAVRLTGYMDGTAYGGTLTTDAVLDRFLVNLADSRREKLKALLNSTAIDRHTIVGFSAASSTRKGAGFFTFIITDEKQFLADMQLGGPLEMEGFSAYDFDGLALFIKGNQAWVTAGDAVDAAAELNRQLDMASNKSVASLNGVSSFLSDTEGMLRMAVAMESTGGSGWTCLTVDLDDKARKIELTGEYLDAAGKRAPMDRYFEPIDMKLLRYSTPSDILVIAVGIPAKTDWEGLIRDISAIYPVNARQRSTFGLLLPYLKRIDGTLLVAVGVTEDDRLTSSGFSNDINFVVAVQADKKKLKETISDIAGVVSVLGLPMIEKDGEYVIHAKGMAPVIMKTVDDDCIVVTNRSLDQLGNDAARQVMKGNTFGLWANVPNATGEAMYGGRGFSLSMELDGNFESDFSFNGSTAPILEQIVTLMSNGNNEPPVADVPGDLGFTPLDTIR